MELFMKTILLIEDDIELAHLICSFLGKHQYHVLHLNNANGLGSITLNTIDLILCDINLPGKDGFSVLSEVRETFDGPIVMLTARSDDKDHIKGLHLGADDYLIKPIAPKLLLARISKLLDNPNTYSPTEIPFNLILDKSKNLLKINEQSLSLTQSEFILLSTLYKHCEQVISRDELFTQCVGRDYDGLARTIDGRIVRLRKKLESLNPETLQLKTVWGKGYLLTHDH